MKKLLRNFFLLIFLPAWFVFASGRASAQQVAFNTTDQFYYNPFDDSNLGVFNNYLVTGTANRTLIPVATTSTTFNGTVALSSVPTVNQKNNIWAQIIPSGARDLNSFDYEWTFLYKNNSAISPIESYNAGSAFNSNVKPGPVISGESAWKYWLSASTNDHTSINIAGFYITQVGTSMIFRYRSNEYDIQSLITFPITNNVLWTIKVQRQTTGRWKIWANPVSGTNYEASTPVGQTDQGNLKDYLFSILETTDLRTAGNNFYWDNIKLYTRRVTLTSVNSAANGITQPSYYAGQTGVVYLGVQLNIRGTYSFTNINLNVSGASANAYLENGKLIRSTDDNYGTSADNTTLTSSVAINGDNIQSGAFTADFYSTSGSTDGSLTKVSNYFFVADTKNPLNYGNTPYSSFQVTGVSGLVSSDYNNQATVYSNNTSSGNNTISFGVIYDWNGSTATSSVYRWNTSTNWTPGGVPGANDVARIGTNLSYNTVNQPSVISNATVGSIIVGANGTANTATINLFTGTTPTTLTCSNGITVNSNVALKLNGIAAGSSFNAGGTSTIQPGASITPALTTITNSGTFTFRSTAAGSGSVGVLTTGGTFAGTYNVERFLSGGGLASNRGYRIVSVPVNQTSALVSSTNVVDLSYIKGFTVNNTSYLGAFTAGTGGTAGGFSAYNANPTLWLYDERQPNSNATFTSGKNIGITSVNSSSVNLSNGSSSVPLYIGNGYLMFFTGPSTRTSGSATVLPTDATITARGFINQGTFNVRLWYTPGGGAAGQLSYTAALGTGKIGYNMLGNPYPSTLDLSKLVTDNSASIDAVYLLNRGAAQAYFAYTANGTSAPNIGYALSGEGFIVHATSAGRTLTFNETQKSTVQLTGSNLLMGIPVKGRTLTGLYMKMEKDSAIYDYCGIYFRNDWKDKFEEDDALYLESSAAKVNMASLSSDGVRAAVNHLPDHIKGSKIKLYVNASTDGSYKLKLEGVRNIDTIYNIFLIDKYKKDSVNIRQTNLYNFNIVKNDTSSYGANRFILSIARKPLPPYKLLNFTGLAVPSGVNVSWKASNEGNYTGFGLEKKQSDNSYATIHNVQSDGRGNYYFIDKTAVTGVNTYRLKQDDIDNKISYTKEITVLKLQGTASLFSVYPNPTQEDIHIELLSTTSSSPTYKLNVYDTTGRLIMQKTSSNRSWTENVSSYITGTYMIEVTDSDGRSVGRTKFVKVR